MNRFKNSKDRKVYSIIFLLMYFHPKLESVFPMNEISFEAFLKTEPNESKNSETKLRFFQ